MKVPGSGVGVGESEPITGAKSSMLGAETTELKVFPVML
jgi:hypothetical protein